MAAVTVNLHKPHKGHTVTFEARLLREAPGERVVLAPWVRPRLELGYVAFETGDQFTEHYYSDRWYAVFTLRSAAGALKGWYCNVSSPARFSPAAIDSDDLDLDLFVSPDRATLLRLDVDEFESRGLAASDPDAYAQAYAALDELERLARAGLAPFDAA